MVAAGVHRQHQYAVRWIEATEKERKIGESNSRLPSAFSPFVANSDEKLCL